MTNPDRLRHVFSTFLGMPPDSDTPPVCGAVLSAAYNGHGQPDCPRCTAILNASRAQADKAIRTCSACGQKFHAIGYLDVYCSTQCAGRTR